MIIGILTHPQGVNYGGILQCYALKTFLEKMGHNTIVIRREPNKQFFLWEWIRTLLSKLHVPRYYKPNVIDRGVQIRPFVERYINRTVPIRSNSDMRKVCTKYGLKAVIVGSDQVWRKSFATCFGYNYFLDFVPRGIIKASYAASLGLDKWEYSPEQTRQICKCLKVFKGVSVREESAIELLKEHVGIEPLHHVDPTLLLTSQDYQKITSPRLVKGKYVFVYWLGDKQYIQDDVCKYKDKGYIVIEMYLRDEAEQMAVEDWLSYIKYADLVITDSFHGCVFSILFEKRFKVHQNISGGVGRISSLFNMLQLEASTTLHDYKTSKVILDKCKGESLNYLLEVFR